jgi:hypothetical protein
MYDNNVNAVDMPGKCVEVQRPTLTERLTQERQGLAARLTELDAAIAALQSNPEIQRILDLVQKVARY